VRGAFTNPRHSQVLFDIAYEQRLFGRMEYIERFIHDDSTPHIRTWVHINNCYYVHDLF